MHKGKTIRGVFALLFGGLLVTGGYSQYYNGGNVGVNEQGEVLENILDEQNSRYQDLLDKIAAKQQKLLKENNKLRDYETQYFSKYLDKSKKVKDLQTKQYLEGMVQEQEDRFKDLLDEYNDQGTAAGTGASTQSIALSNQARLHLLEEELSKRGASTDNNRRLIQLEQKLQQIQAENQRLRKTLASLAVQRRKSVSGKAPVASKKNVKKPLPPKNRVRRRRKK